MGSVMNRELALRLQALQELGVRSAADAAAFASDLLNPQRWAALPPGVLAAARQDLAAALRGVHWVVLLCAGAALGVGARMPEGRLGERPQRGTAVAGEARHGEKLARAAGGTRVANRAQG